MQKLQLRSMLQVWLEEDLGSGDITSELLVAGQQVTAIIHAKESGVIAGLEAAAEVFRLLDPEVQFRCLVSDGEEVQAGALLAEISGSARALLSGERLALNLLQHLSGIATKTARWQKLLHGTKARLTDTRKALPGLRQLQKQAVRLGGGANHRMGLFDGVLIKDNHIKIAGGVAKAVRLAKAGAPHTLKVEVEVEDLAGLDEALSAGADIIMLDNMGDAMMIEAVRLAKGRAILEASGGLSEERLAAVAATGVDFISAGALTHSVQALDISMDIGTPKSK